MAECSLRYRRRGVHRLKAGRLTSKSCASSGIQLRGIPASRKRTASCVGSVGRGQARRCNRIRHSVSVHIRKSTGRSHTGRRPTPTASKSMGEASPAPRVIRVHSKSVHSARTLYRRGRTVAGGGDHPSDPRRAAAAQERTSGQPGGAAAVRLADRGRALRRRARDHGPLRGDISLA